MREGMRPKNMCADGFRRDVPGAGWCSDLLKTGILVLCSVSAWIARRAGSVFGVLQADIPTGISHTRQYTACGLFFGAQARPVDFVMHAARSEGSQTGAACPIAARAGPLQAAHFDGVKQGLVSPCVALLATGLEFGSEKFRSDGRVHRDQ